MTHEAFREKSWSEPETWCECAAHYWSAMLAASPLVPPKSEE